MCVPTPSTSAAALTLKALFLFLRKIHPMPYLVRRRALSPSDWWLDLTALSLSLTTILTAWMPLPSATATSALSHALAVRSRQGTAASCPERHSTQQRKATAPSLTLLCCGKKLAMSAMTTPYLGTLELM